MSALADALVAAQRRALAAMERFYVAGKLPEELFREHLRQIGLNDELEADRIVAALDVMREYGAQPPAETNGATEKPPEKSSEAQRSYITKLLAEGQYQPLAEQDLALLTKERASELIGQLKGDTYDPSAWDVPF